MFIKLTKVRIVQVCLMFLTAFFFKLERRKQIEARGILGGNIKG